MNFLNDNRTILLLDAGGTNFVFTAKKNGKDIVHPISKPSNGHDLELCITTMKSGFREVIQQLDEYPAAISFAFPGPADYKQGIIGELNNLKGFSGGVPLGPILRNEFNIPVFINNDGDLFAMGEAAAGVLPEINQALEEAGSNRRYKNLVGITLGTGLGGGIAINNQLLRGDNSMGTEIWIISNRYDDQAFAENKVSTEAIKKSYSKLSGEDNLMPKDIYDIAVGNREGNRIAAEAAFVNYGRNLGDVIANLITIVDGIVVLGGGIAAAESLFMPHVLSELNGFFEVEGKRQKRLVQKVYYYNNEYDREYFLRDSKNEIIVPGTGEKLNYEPQPRIPLVISNRGASESIALGAYIFALQNITNDSPAKSRLEIIK